MAGSAPPLEELLGSSLSAGKPTSYTYDANNQLLTIARLGTTSFQYDAVGNRTPGPPFLEVRPDL